MRLLKLSFLTLCCAALATTLHAAKPSADELIARYQEARGGAKAWAALGSMRMYGVMLMGDVRAPLRLEFKRDQRVRMEYEVNGQKMVQAFDGSDGWTQASFLNDGEVSAMDDQELLEMRNLADFDGAIIDYRRKGHLVELLDQEEVEGRSAWRLGVSKSDGSQEWWWLDAETYLAVKTSNRSTRNGEVIGVASAMGEYREVDGLWIPFTVINTIQRGMESMVQTVRIEQIDTNVELADSYFRQPGSGD